MAPEPPFADSIAQAWLDINERVRRAGGGDVTVLPVTKTYPVDAIRAVIRAGARAVGENYVQEIDVKLEALGADEVDIHMIGQLQSNKVRRLAGRIALYETVDRSSLARELARRDPGARVLIQVDTTHQPGKGGCPLNSVDQLADEVRSLGLDLRGLMTVGPTDGTPEDARAGFRLVRRAVDRLGLPICSMGMSNDLEVAIQEGSTQVRVGSALFGPRSVHLRGVPAR